MVLIAIWYVLFRFKKEIFIASHSGPDPNSCLVQVRSLDAGRNDADQFLHLLFNPIKVI